MIVQDHRREVPGLKEFYWMYQRGWLGRSRIKSEDDAVVSVGYCPGLLPGGPLAGRSMSFARSAIGGKGSCR